MVIDMKKLIFSVICMFALIPCFASAKVTARFEKDTISKNDQAVLILQSDEETSAQPDLSVLQNLFNVNSTSLQRQTYIINGQINHELIWRFSLTPLKKGKIIIEPIVVGNQKTNSLQIIVSDSITPEASQNEMPQTAEPLYHIETQILSPKNKQPFIQQQIDYAVRLIDDGMLKIDSIAFDSNEDFLVQELKKPKVIQLSNGKREITFSYALFALKSGKLKLPRARIQGVSFQNTNTPGFFQGGFFGFQIPSAFSVQTPVTLVSEEEEINVLPALKEHNFKWWLPAKDISVTAHFINKPQTVRVGTVLKREIIIKAVGLTGEQLPQIETFSSNMFKQYPEAPRTETTVYGADVVGTLYLADVYIPQKTGVVTLPEIKIDWYDTQEKQIKTALLKAEKLHIFKNNGLKEEKENTKNAEPTKPLASQTPTEQKLTQKLPQMNTYTLLALAFIGGMFVCYLMIKPKKENKTKPQKEKDMKEKDIFSIKKNDLKALRDKLILWAQTNNKDKKITNLKDVADLLGDADFQNAVEKLSMALYSDSLGQNFNIRAFQKTFKKAVKKKSAAAKKKELPLPPLYS